MSAYTSFYIINNFFCELKRSIYAIFAIFILFFGFDRVVTTIREQEKAAALSTVQTFAWLRIACAIDIYIYKNTEKTPKSVVVEKQQKAHAKKIL